MRGSVFVELLEADLREAGDVLLSHAEVTGSLANYRDGSTFEMRDGPVVFNSVGIAIEDIAAPKLIYEKLAKV